jgi:hypothetical protein
MPLQIRESRWVPAVTALEACGVGLFQLLQVGPEVPLPFS